MSNFANLKKNSTALDRLTKEIEKINQPAEKSGGDDRFWKLERDKSGNGSAIIRFLSAPAVDGDDALPWVRIFDHGFKGPTGKWYIENSLTTLGQKDPVSEFNSKLWNQDTSENSPSRKQAREQKRRLKYIANILVISDPKHPENEGKVFLYSFGKKIFDKISLAMNPEFEGDDAINPFDFWKGANFRLRIRTVEGYPNYDQSSWEAPSAIDKTDAELEALWKSEYSLKEFIDPKNFKSYDELKRKLEDVLDIDPFLSDAPRKAAPVADEAPREIRKTAPSVAQIEAEEDEDPEMAEFRAMANRH